MTKQLKDVLLISGKRRKNLLNSVDELLEGTREKENPIQSSQDVERMSISLLAEEKEALENKTLDVRRIDKGVRTSRLARIAFKMLQDASVEDILKFATEVPNLESRKGRR